MSDYFNNKPVPCPKCGGSGVYNWGGTENGKPKHSGDCYSCAKQGWQGIAKVRANFGYNKHIHWSPDGEPNHEMASSSSMAEGVFNDILHHNVDRATAIKACQKYGAKAISNIGGNGEVWKFYDGSTLKLNNKSMKVGWVEDGQ
jgi:hypothetical protein